MPNLVFARFVRGSKIVVDGLTREELRDEELLNARGASIIEQAFGAENLDKGAKRALRSQRRYNRAHASESMRYVLVSDKKGRARDPFDKA